MDDFDYLQEDALTKWADKFIPKVDYEDVLFENGLKKIEQEFLPRFESQIYQNQASKMLTNANDATSQLRVSA